MAVQQPAHGQAHAGPGAAASESALGGALRGGRGAGGGAREWSEGKDADAE